MDNNELLQAVQSAEEQKSSSMSSWIFLIASLFIFVSASSFAWDFNFVVTLAVAILIHEIGHVLAMKCFAYKNVSMLFIPFLGGMASGVPQEESGTKNVLVSLAGPVFGLLFGGLLIYIGYLCDYTGEIWLMFFILTIFLNLFNLLPVMPLDGGQVVNEIILSRSPRAELVFNLLGILALGYFAYSTDSYILGAFVLFLLMSVTPTFQISTVIKSVQAREDIDTSTMNAENVGAVRDVIVKEIEFYRNERAKEHLPGAILRVFKSAQKKHPSLTASIVLMLVYLAVFIGGTLSVVAIIAERRGESMWDVVQSFL